MRISDYLKKEFCIMELKASTKEEAIRELSSVLKLSGKIKNLEDFIKHILEREALGSTGIGNRVAIPHSPSESVEGLVVAFGRSLSGIDFQSIDGEEVNFIFLMGTNPSDLNIYLKLLATLSRLLNDRLFRDELVGVNTPEEIIDLFKKHERGPETIKSQYFD
jgi:fructose-specific phosphotransferase system IIA component